MKKIILASVFTVFTAGVFAQNAALDAQLKEATCKATAEEIAKGEKATLDPKKGLKSANWVKLAVAYVDMANQCGKDSMASEKAFNTYQKALEVDKTAGGKGVKEIEDALKGQVLYTALMQQGAGAYNGKNLKNALKLFKLAFTVNPKDTTAALYAGIVAQNEKDNESAKKYFSEYLEIGGKSPEVFYSLAQIYKNEKNTAKALEVLKKGVVANPSDKDLKGEIVNMNISSGDSESAINELKKLVEADPKNVNNVLNLGILYNNSADGLKQKAEDLRKADKNNPEIAKLEAESKAKKDISTGYYKKVIELDPNNYDCNFNLGVLYFNEAVEMKKEIDKMDMKTYQKDGKAIEERVCAKFNEAKPYFDRCKATKPNEEDLKNTMEGLAGVLDQCSKRK